MIIKMKCLKLSCLSFTCILVLWLLSVCTVTAGEILDDNLDWGAQNISGPLASECSSLEPSIIPLHEHYSKYSGMRIASVRHKTIDVFDGRNPKERNRLYRALNRVHVNTRTSVVLSQLLFTEGGDVDVSVLAESERLLRSRAYLSNAFIVVDQVCGESVALLVVTRDVWTTEPEFNLGREGGENQHGFGLKEGNIAGSGAIFQVGYYKDATRSRVDYGFYSPHVLNTRLTLALNFSEASDGQQSYFAVKRPFYSLQAPWASGVSLKDTTIIEAIRTSDQELNAYKHQHEYREVFFGLAVAPNDKRARRLSWGLVDNAHTFSPTRQTSSILPRSYQHSYPWLEFNYLENVFGVYTNLNLLHQTEDVALGADVKFRIGYAGNLFGNTEEAILYNLKYDDLLGLGPNHLLKMSSSIEGQYHVNNHAYDEATWGGTLGYYYLFRERHRLYSSLSYFQGHQLSLHRELTAGGVTGLRGYPLDYQRGSRKYVGTLEKRYISDWHIANLVRVGLVMFVDVGKAWGGAYSSSKDLANVGFGLRLGSSKARVGSVLHIDLAVPLVDQDQVDSFQLIIKGSRGL